MFYDKELEVTKDYCERKIEDVLNKAGGSDIDYIRNLQTLITLKDSADQKINRVAVGKEMAIEKCSEVAGLPLPPLIATHPNGITGDKPYP